MRQEQLNQLCQDMGYEDVQAFLIARYNATTKVRRKDSSYSHDEGRRRELSKKRPHDLVGIDKEDSIRINHNFDATHCWLESRNCEFKDNKGEVFLDLSGYVNSDGIAREIGYQINKMLITSSVKMDPINGNEYSIALNEDTPVNRLIVELFQKKASIDDVDQDLLAAAKAQLHNMILEIIYAPTKTLHGQDRTEEMVCSAYLSFQKAQYYYLEKNERGAKFFTSTNRAALDHITKELKPIYDRINAYKEMGPGILRFLTYVWLKLQIAWYNLSNEDNHYNIELLYDYSFYKASSITEISETPAEAASLERPRSDSTSSTVSQADSGQGLSETSSNDGDDNAPRPI